MQKDIRWQQRFSNYQKALAKLKEVSDLNKEELSDLEKEGIIQRFEYTHELAWNTLKDLLKYEGASDSILGSRDATRSAFAAGLIEDGDSWMEMITARNQTSHTYNEKTANEIFEKIITKFLPNFQKLEMLLLHRIEEN